MPSDRTAAFLKNLEAQRATLRQEVEGDVAPLRALTIDERAKVLESVCRDAMAIVRARADASEVLARREPSASWHSVVQRYRHGRD
ncbi:MAG: hypothetical protein QM817_35840 [Archangium sp.]